MGTDKQGTKNICIGKIVYSSKPIRMSRGQLILSFIDWNIKIGITWISKHVITLLQKH